MDNANGSESEDIGFQAPLVKKGSKLRLARPDERHPRRLENHQTEWGILHGMFLAYRKGDVPVARGYLNRYAKGREDLIISLLKVWAVEASDETLRRGADALIFGLK